jgi:hypothetical protein
MRELVTVTVTDCNGDGAGEVPDTAGEPDGTDWRDDEVDVHPAQMTKNTTSTTGTKKIRFISYYIRSNINKISI